MPSNSKRSMMTSLPAVATTLLGNLLRSLRRIPRSLVSDEAMALALDCALNSTRIMLAAAGESEKR